MRPEKSKCRDTEPLYHLSAMPKRTERPSETTPEQRSETTPDPKFPNIRWRPARKGRATAAFLAEKAARGLRERPDRKGSR